MIVKFEKGLRYPKDNSRQIIMMLNGGLSVLDEDKRNQLKELLNEMLEELQAREEGKVMGESK